MMKHAYTNQPFIQIKRFRKVILLLSLIFLFFILTAFLSVQHRPEKPFFTHLDEPIVIAHRGGDKYPPNTLVAFSYAESIGVDAIEFDLHMTKDGHLVVIHDNTVDRTTNGTGRIDSFDLSEIKQLDAAYHYQDEKGNYPYRGKGVTIPTLEEVFETFPHMFMDIEIKDRYPINKESEIEEKLWKLIQHYGMEDKVIISSFQQEIIKKFNELSEGTVAISGGTHETSSFFILHKLFLGKLYVPAVDALVIPTKSRGFNLANEKLIQSAQKLNMKVIYWTINEEEEMRRLLKLGANGIITDKPELLLQIIDEMSKQKERAALLS